MMPKQERQQCVEWPGPGTCVPRPCTGLTAVQASTLSAIARAARRERMARAHGPNSRAKSRSLAQTMQWMGRSGVLRMVQTGNDLGTGAGLHS